MITTDPIADMLTRIRNAYSVGKDSVSMQPSKMKEAVLYILKENGYINEFKKEGSKLVVNLKYNNDSPAATKMERVSRPGRRVYVKKSEIPTVLSGEGIAIISTSRGIITGEEAKKENLGGELIAKVY